MASTVRPVSSSSTMNLRITRERGADLAGLEVTATTVGLVNHTESDVVIPAGATLYLTVISNRRLEDGTVSARCVDIRVWQGDRAPGVKVNEAEVPF